MHLKIPRAHFDALVSHAVEDLPNVCCGLLAGREGVVEKTYRTTNIDHRPYRYEIEADELLNTLGEIDDNCKELVAIYSSRTTGPAYPSETDVRLATYPEAHYVYVSIAAKDNPALRAFSIREGIVTEVTIDVLEVVAVANQPAAEQAHSYRIQPPSKSVTPTRHQSEPVPGSRTFALGGLLLWSWIGGIGMLFAIFILTATMDELSPFSIYMILALALTGVPMLLITIGGVAESPPRDRIVSIAVLSVFVLLGIVIAVSKLTP
jgi:proteasome lid subunit RPN8/RPN11